MLTENLEYQGGALRFDGVPLDALARRFGTPLYVYSEDLVRMRLDKLRRDFAGIDPLVCYAMKANSNSALLRSIARTGAGVEVVSGGELFLALKAGFPASRILFSGVGKTPQEIREALDAGILLFNVESEAELSEIEEAARALRKKAPVALRLNPDIDAGTHRHIATGKAENKFGIPVEDAARVWKRASRSASLSPLGLHIHLGSQIHDVRPYKRSVARLLELSKRLSADGAAVRFADIGGGFAVPYGEGSRLDTRELARAAAPLRAHGLAVIIEPGRYLVGEAGLLLTKVLYVKRGRGKAFAIVDAGMTDLLRPALYGARHPVVPVREGKAPASFEVVGPICESADSFGEFRLPSPEAGELWAVLVAGAYGYAMSSQYNGRPRPAEIVITHGRPRVARPRETYRDLL